MYQIAHFDKLYSANEWLRENPGIEIVEFKSFYVPSNVLAILILYKTKKSEG